MSSDIFIPGDVYRFYCPECKAIRPLEVVSSNATITQVVTLIAEDMYGDDAYFEVGPDTLVHDADADRFQCNRCGHVVAADTGELNLWHKRQEGK